MYVTSNARTWRRLILWMRQDATSHVWMLQQVWRVR